MLSPLKSLLVRPVERFGKFIIISLKKITQEWETTKIFLGKTKLVRTVAVTLGSFIGENKTRLNLEANCT